jgi:hypothetical protein
VAVAPALLRASEGLYRLGFVEDGPKYQIIQMPVTHLNLYDKLKGPSWTRWQSLDGVIAKTGKLCAMDPPYIHCTGIMSCYHNFPKDGQLLFVEAAKYVARRDDEDRTAHIGGEDLLRFSYHPNLKSGLQLVAENCRSLDCCFYVMKRELTEEEKKMCKWEKWISVTSRSRFWGLLWTSPLQTIKETYSFTQGGKRGWIGNNSGPSSLKTSFTLWLPNTLQVARIESSQQGVPTRAVPEGQPEPRYAITAHGRCRIA